MRQRGKDDPGYFSRIGKMGGQAGKGTKKKRKHEEPAPAVTEMIAPALSTLDAILKELNG